MTAIADETDTNVISVLLAEINMDVVHRIVADFPATLEIAAFGIEAEARWNGDLREGQRIVLCICGQQGETIPDTRRCLRDRNGGNHRSGIYNMIQLFDNHSGNTGARSGGTGRFAAHKGNRGIVLGRGEVEIG